MTFSIATIGGIALGLAAAVGQSVSYFCSKLFVIRRGNAVLRLLVLGHLLMGVLSLAALPLLWPSVRPSLAVIFWPTVKVSLYYLLGQGFFFLALRYDDASRLSPLLGLKILVLAVLYTTWLHTPLAPLQWAGAILTVAAAFLLNYSGKPLTPMAAVSVVLACIFYCLSDLHIGWLVGGMLQFTNDRLIATLLSVSFSYILCGLIALVLLPIAGKESLREWHYALPFAVSWLVAMGFLFACFNAIGVLYGNLVQATRGLMTVIMAAAIAGLGFVRIEPVVGRGVFLRRIAAALLMLGAIAIYLLAGYQKV